jgi:hypothetical protein
MENRNFNDTDRMRMKKTTEKKYNEISKDGQRSRGEPGDKKHSIVSVQIPVHLENKRCSGFLRSVSKIKALRIDNTNSSFKIQPFRNNSFSSKNELRLEGSVEGDRALKENRFRICEMNGVIANSINRTKSKEVVVGSTYFLLRKYLTNKAIKNPNSDVSKCKARLKNILTEVSKTYYRV